MDVEMKPSILFAFVTMKLMWRLNERNVIPRFFAALDLFNVV